MSTSQSWWPTRRDLGLVIHSLTPGWGRFLLAMIALVVVSALGLFWQLNRSWATEVAITGGELLEGVVGSPRLINPLLATSDAERDLVALVYSGLMRINQTGQPEPDLAERVETSPDGLIYTFTLKPNLRWHDGTPLTAADILFTISKAQDPALKSPRRASWEGITAEQLDDRTIRLTLQQPYPAFLDNATMGILPRHIWGQFDTETFSLNQFNSEPIGSGPYKIESIKKDELGIPEYYNLQPFNNFALTPAKIKRLRLTFYRNEEELIKAYQAGDVHSINALSAAAAKTLEEAGAEIIKSPLPRIFGLFFNHNKAPVLAQAEVRQALELAVNKQAIVDSVLLGYGQVINHPLPPLAIPKQSSLTIEPAKSEASQPSLEKARELLTKNGWVFGAEQKVWKKKTKAGELELRLILSVPDTPELRQAAELVIKDWQALGVAATLKIFELGDFTQYVIRPRDYEAVLFGEILGRNLDLFSFWHSSQRLDPGLNIALYTNISVDKLLENSRNLSDQELRTETYNKIEAEIIADHPAVFLYSPYFLYILPKEIKGVKLPPLNLASDRFLTINQWFMDTDRVWNIFIN